MGWIDYDSYELAHFHVPLVLFAIGANIVDRHFQAFAAVERGEAQREKALSRERQRIMADMHDGLGSSLVGLLGAVQSGRAPLPEVERRLHDALPELRLAGAGLAARDGDLHVVLGEVRPRPGPGPERFRRALWWAAGAGAARGL